MIVVHLKNYKHRLFIIQLILECDFSRVALKNTILKWTEQDQSS